MRILIVEDDYTSRKILLKYLSDFGECEIATSGEEALTSFKAAIEKGKPFDLICLDIMLPEKDGFDVLASMREMEMKIPVGKEKKIKVIITTALDNRNDIIRGFQSGCDSYMVKPLVREKLLREFTKIGLKI